MLPGLEDHARGAEDGLRRELERGVTRKAASHATVGERFDEEEDVRRARTREPGHRVEERLGNDDREPDRVEQRARELEVGRRRRHARAHARGARTHQGPACSASFARGAFPPAARRRACRGGSRPRSIEELLGGHRRCDLAEHSDEHLWLHREGHHVRLAHALDVVRRRSDSETRGETVTERCDGLADEELLLRDRSACEEPLDFIAVAMLPPPRKRTVLPRAMMAPGSARSRGDLPMPSGIRYRPPVDREAWLLRDKLEAFLRDEAESRLALVRSDADADPREVVFARHAWLASAAARDALGELRERGRISEEEAIATARHLARYVRERELAGVRTTLRAFGARRLEVDGEGVRFADIVAELFGATDQRLAELARAVEHAANRALGPIREARARGDEAASSLDRIARPSSAEAAKREDDARRPRAGRRGVPLGDPGAARGGHVVPLVPIARGADLRDARGRAPFRRARRPRLASDACTTVLRARRSALGRSRARSASAGRSVDGRDRARTSTLVMTAPTDVRLVASSLELGVLSEMSFAEAAGGALVRALANPALPAAVARPIDTSFARTIGRLLAMIALDAQRLDRDRRVPDRVLDRLRRAAATIALLELRVAAASIALGGRRDLDASSDRLADALGVRIPAPVAALVLETPRRAEERFRAGIAALAGSFALRDLYDEDYLRNPRMAEHLRVLAGRGGAATAETFVTETYADPKLAPRRLVGWFQGRE